MTVRIFVIDSDAIFVPAAIACFSLRADFAICLKEFTIECNVLINEEQISPYFASKKTEINNRGTVIKQIDDNFTDEINETMIPVVNVEIACKIKLSGYPIAWINQI